MLSQVVWLGHGAPLYKTPTPKYCTASPVQSVAYATEIQRKTGFTHIQKATALHSPAGGISFQFDIAAGKKLNWPGCPFLADFVAKVGDEKGVDHRWN